jgi:hypothetical protein
VGEAKLKRNRAFDQGASPERAPRRRTNILRASFCRYLLHNHIVSTQYDLSAMESYRYKKGVGVPLPVLKALTLGDPGPRQPLSLLRQPRPSSKTPMRSLNLRSSADSVLSAPSAVSFPIFMSLSADATSPAYPLAPLHPLHAGTFTLGNSCTTFIRDDYLPPLRPLAPFSLPVYPSLPAPWFALLRRPTVSPTRHPSAQTHF